MRKASRLQDLYIGIATLNAAIATRRTLLFNEVKPAAVASEEVVFSPLLIAIFCMHKLSHLIRVELVPKAV